MISKIFNLYPEKEREGKEIIFDSLIQNRIQGINRKNALMYIQYIYNKEVDYSFNVSSLFSLLEQFKTIKLTVNQLEVLFNEDIEDKTGYYRFYILYRLYKMGNQSIKKRVLKIIEKVLDNISTFDYKMFNLFVREKIVPYSEEYFKTFSKIVVDHFNSIKQVNYPNQTDREIKSLNEYINHIYEHYEDSYKYLKPFLGCSEYYNFVINPSNFDAEKFDIHWFYIAYRKSYFAIKKIIIENKEVMRIVSNKIFEPKNNKYYEAYIDLMAHIYT